MAEKQKFILSKLHVNIKRKFNNFFHSRDNQFTLTKLITLIAFLNAIIQLGLCNIHNNAVYKVYQTVAVYSFFFFIILLLSAVNAIRLKENKKYYIYSFIFLPIVITLGIIYITKCLTDVYYLQALSGALRNGTEIVWAIEDSCVLMSIGVVLALACLILTIIELFLENKKSRWKNGSFNN